MQEPKKVVDIIKFIMALMIVGLHCRPFLELSQSVDFYFSGGLARLGVPYFFCVTGYFLFTKIQQHNCPRIVVIGYCKRIFLLWCAWSLVYLPIMVKTIYNSQNPLFDAKMIVWWILINGESYYHLWYLHASIVAIAFLWLLLYLRLSLKSIILLGAMLYCIAIGGRGYYSVYEYVFPEGSIVNDVMCVLGQYISPINGLTEGLICIALGAVAANRKKDDIGIGKYFYYMVICVTLYIVELCVIRHFNLYNIGVSASFLLLPATYSILLFSVQARLSYSNNEVFVRLRSYSMYIYLLHPLVMFLIFQLESKVLGWSFPSLIYYIITVGVSLILSAELYKYRNGLLFRWLT